MAFHQYCLKNAWHCRYSPLRLHFSHLPPFPFLFLFLYSNEILVSWGIRRGHAAAKSLCFSIKKLGWRLQHREAARRGVISPRITKRKIISLHTTVRDLNDIKGTLNGTAVVLIWYLYVRGKRQNPAGSFHLLNITVLQCDTNTSGKLQTHKSSLFKRKYSTSPVSMYFIFTALVWCYINRNIKCSSN